MSFLSDIIPDSNSLSVSFARNGQTADLLQASYDVGFIGAFQDTPEHPDWSRRAARYMQDEFIAETPGYAPKYFSDIEGSLGEGDGECHINTKDALELWQAGQGVEPFAVSQDYGSCVDASAAEHVTALLGWRAARDSYHEVYRHPAAWYWYAARGYCQDGWTGAGIATQARRHGVAFRVKYELAGGSVDFRDDDENEQIVARQWCRTGIPDWLHDYTAANHPFDQGAITAFDGRLAELKKLFKAGGVLHTSGTRTSGGPNPFTIGSVGPHMQSAYGCDDGEQFRQFCQDVIGVPARQNDFPVVLGQTWGPGWRGECADQYWPPWWGPKPQGAWVWWASDLLDRLSCDFVWLPWVRGFPAEAPSPTPPVPYPVLSGVIYAEQAGTVIAVRGEQLVDVPAGHPGGKFTYIVVPDGTGKYRCVPKPVI